MGMYTRLSLNVAIAEDAPIVEELKQMIAGEGTGAGRRAWMLNSSSYYHDNINARSFNHDTISKCWKLSVCCDLKNYENEIAWFLGWIAPHVRTDELAGYWRYEEDHAPMLIWFIDGKVVEIDAPAPKRLK